MIELLSFEYNPPSYQKFGFQLNADRGGVNMEVLHLVHEICFEIFFLCREMNHLKIKFWEINTIVASYYLVLVTLEMGLTVDFSHRFNYKF